MATGGNNDFLLPFGGWDPGCWDAGRDGTQHKYFLTSKNIKRHQQQTTSISKKTLKKL
jgi:hypothetical protein